MSVGADIVGRWDATESDGTSSSSTFQEPAANLHVSGDLGENLRAYAELQVPPDPNELLSNTSLNGIFLSEAYVNVNEIVPVDLKFGKFVVDFGNRHLQRSDNAQVQDNPLIGNDLLDPVGRQSGLEFSAEHAGGRMGWALGITNGTAGSNYFDGNGYAFIPKVWGDFGLGLNGAVSYYTVDPDTAGSDNLFTRANTREGLYTIASDPYQATPVSFTVGGAAGGGLRQASLGKLGGGLPGNDISAWQVDFGWDGQMGEVNAWWISVEDEAPSPSVELRSYGLEGVFNFTPDAYGAFRYSTASTETSGATAGESDRLQVGAGYHLTERAVAKLEWVDQTNELGSPAVLGFNTRDADGFLVELSASF